MIDRSPRASRFLFTAGLAALLFTLPSAGTPLTPALDSKAVPLAPPAGEFDTFRVLGPMECAECHEPETAVWKASRHVLGGKRLTRNPEAKAIASALGIRRIKSDERCATCHFTQQEQASERVKSIAEVSCESCHGAARDWLDAHSDFGGAEASAETETEEHRVGRLALCDELGMRRPAHMLEMGSRCLDCHLIADAELLTAGHPTGTGFELMSWSQGEVRHNFVRGKGANVESNPKRQRQLFVLGRVMQLERSLLALAGPELPQPQQAEIAGLASDAIETLVRVSKRMDWKELDQMLSAVAALDLNQKDSAAILDAALLLTRTKPALEASSHGLDLQTLDFGDLTKEGSSATPTE